MSKSVFYILLAYVYGGCDNSKKKNCCQRIMDPTGTETRQYLSRLFVTEIKQKNGHLCLNGIAESVKCVFSALVVLSTDCPVGCSACEQKITVRS